MTRKSTFPWGILIVGLIFVGCYTAYSIQEKRATREQDALVEKVLHEIQDGTISNGPAFTQRCGHPDHITKVGSDLVFAYVNNGVSVSFIRKHPKDPMDLTANISFWSLTSPGRTLSPHAAIAALNCSA
jgi:hypothetical protein